MFDAIGLIFQQEFLMRALVVGVLISLCCSLLGVSLVLKRFSMIGDGLSHVSFGAMAIAAVANLSPLAFALPIVVISAFVLLRMSEKSKVKGDAAIALVSTGALAMGIMVTSMTTGMNVDIYNYMFGSILTMSESDVVISTILSVAVISIFFVFYHEIFAVTFDESFAKATGTKVSLYNMLIAALTAVTIVIGMKMMGALLISSLIIFPTVTSLRVCKSYKKVVFCGAAISVFCFLSGLVFSIKYEAPTGASVVCINIFMLVVFTVIKNITSLDINKKLKTVLQSAVCLLSLGAFLLVMMFSSAETYKKDKTTIVTTAFVHYDFARQISGDKADVIMLLSPGEESHTYEPTPADILKIQQCDVFVYTGGESEHWVDEILQSIEKDVKTVKMMEVTELYKESHKDGMQTEHENDHIHDEHEEYDEHVWTSPENAVKIVEAIAASIISVDKVNEDYYRNNASEYISKLLKLDTDFKEMFSHKNKDYIIVADRFPLMYFTKHYTLDYYAAFPGCSAQVEANPATVAFLIDKVNDEKVSTVFKVDLSKGNLARSISDATGAKVDTLYSCHVISAEDFEKGENYISLMYRNLEALRLALI